MRNIFHKTSNTDRMSPRFSTKQSEKFIPNVTILLHDVWALEVVGSSFVENVYHFQGLLNLETTIDKFSREEFQQIWFHLTPSFASDEHETNSLHFSLRLLPPADAIRIVNEFFDIQI